MKRLLCLLPLWVVCAAALADPPGRRTDLYELPLDELVRVQIPPQADVGSRDGAHSVLDATVPIDVYTAEQLLSVGQNGLAVTCSATSAPTSPGSRVIHAPGDSSVTLSLKD